MKVITERLLTKQKHKILDDNWQREKVTKKIWSRYVK